MKEKEDLSVLLKYLDSNNTFNSLNVNSAPFPLDVFVPVREWVEHKYYTGDVEIWPYWKEKFIEFMDSGRSELIITGSTRSGKNFFTNLIIMRQLYELSFYKYNMGSSLAPFPALNKTSVLNILILSVTIKQAEKTCFKELRNLIDNSPYFMNHFPRNPHNNSELIFDNDRIMISVATSFISSLTGTNAMMMILDEANLVGSENNSFETASETYAESYNRRIQTFKNEDGRLFGYNVLISSADTNQSFIETRIRESKDDGTSFVIKTKKFEIQPKLFGVKRFYIFAGDKNFDHFVLNVENKKKYEDLLKYLNVENIKDYLNYENQYEVAIPEEHLDMFEEAPEDFYHGALVDATRVLRDVCGRSLGGTGNFFNNVVQYKNCLDSSLIHPFYKDVIEVSTANTNVRDNELINSLKPDFMGEKNKIYGIALDLSKRKDDTGMALGYYDMIKQKIVIVLKIKIAPPSDFSHKIRYHSIIEFIDYLIKDRRFNIKNLWVDGYQSEYFMQYYQERNIDSMLQSVDRTDNQYIQFRNAILEGSVSFYDYDEFRNELFALIHNRAEKIVDHPPTGSKDISDACCRLYYGLKIRNNVVGAGSVKATLMKLVNKNRTLLTMEDDINKQQMMRLENEMTGKPQYDKLARLLNKKSSPF